MRALAAGLAVTWAACSTPPRDPLPEAPAIERFDASAVIVRAPDRGATVSWRVRGADRVELRGAGDAPLPVPAVGERAVEVADRVALELLAEGPGGSARATLELVRALPNAVELRSFVVTPERVRAGDAVEVSWDAPGALGVALRVVDGPSLVADAPPQGSVAFVPALGVTELELRADGTGGPLRDRRTVEARRDPPTIQAFSVLPAVAEEGQLITASWQLLGPTRTCTVSREGPDGRASEASSGSRGAVAWVLAAGRYHVALACEGPTGEAHAAQDVVVVPVAAAAWIVGVSPTRVGAGGSVDVAFGATGTTRLLIETPSSRDVVDVARGHVVVQARPETFPVTVAPLDRPGRADTATVTVDPALPIFAQADAGVLGGDVEVRWSIAGADRLVVRGHDSDAVYLETPASSGDVTIPVPADEVYLRLVAEGPAGASARWVRITGR